MQQMEDASSEDGRIQDPYKIEAKPRIWLEE